MNPEWSQAEAEETPSPKRARGWPEKFAEAFHGVWLGVRGQASFCVHFFFATLAIAAAILLECNRIEWCFIVFCIGLVFTTELVNSSLETLFHGLEPEVKARLRGVLDIAAGAVLIASFTAVIVGGLILIPRMLIFAGIVQD